MHPTQEEEYSEEGTNEPELVNPNLFCKQLNGRSLISIAASLATTILENRKKSNDFRTYVLAKDPL